MWGDSNPGLGVVKGADGLRSAIRQLWELQEGWGDWTILDVYGGGRCGGMPVDRNREGGDATDLNHQEPGFTDFNPVKGQKMVGEKMEGRKEGIARW